MVTDSAGVLVVTGGSRGIGAAVCRLAATRGYDLVVNYSSDGQAARAVADDLTGVRAVAVGGDVSEQADVARLFDAAAELGPLAGLVNNAGITGNTPGRLDEHEPDVVRRVFDVNVTGVFL